MSFLNQLKAQASALQREQGVQQLNLEAHTAQTEAACKVVWHYLSDLAKQLDVLKPAGPRFTLDGKTPWPAMKLERFRADSRKKMLRNKEVFDYVGMGWQIVAQAGTPIEGSVTVNFPPDLERVQARLAMGWVRHERREVRHPEKNTLQAIRFDYVAETRGNVTVTPDHDHATLAFRVVNASGFEVLTATWPAAKVQTGVLDELAKLIVAQPSQFAQG